MDSSLTPIKINDTHICTLQIQRDKKLKVRFFEILQPFEESVNRILALLDDEETDSNYIINEILSERALKPLINGSFNFCEELYTAYQSWSTPLSELLKLLYTGSLTRKEKNDQKIRIKSLFMEQLRAYNLELTYDECEEEKTILAYSHRRIGFRYLTFKLDENIEIGFKSNFGYGSASYFYTILTYRGLDIIPFSEWVEFYYANLAELNHYSAKHFPDNEDWQDAMEYGEEAYNLAHLSEEKFVEKYLINECSALVGGLESILSGQKFEFMNSRRIYTQLTETGTELVCFKGEKISGALDFISKIEEFCVYTNMHQFIARIEDCNKKLLPILIGESDSVQISLDEHKVKFEEVTKIFEPIRSKKYQLNDLVEIFNLFLDSADFGSFSVDYFGSKFGDEFIEYFEKTKEKIGVSQTYEQFLSPEFEVQRGKLEEYIKRKYRKEWYLRIILDRIDRDIFDRFILFFDKVYSHRFVFAEYTNESFSGFVNGFMRQLKLNDDYKNFELTDEEISGLFTTIESYRKSSGKEYFDFNEGFIDRLINSVDSLRYYSENEGIRLLLDKAKNLHVDIWIDFVSYLESQYANDDHFGLERTNYKEFVALNDLYSNIKSEYESLESKVRYFKNLLSKINSYISKINQYFESKKAA